MSSCRLAGINYNKWISWLKKRQMEKIYHCQDDSLIVNLFLKRSFGRFWGSLNYSLFARFQVRVRCIKTVKLTTNFAQLSSSPQMGALWISRLNILMLISALHHRTQHLKRKKINLLTKQKNDSFRRVCQKYIGGCSLNGKESGKCQICISKMNLAGSYLGIEEGGPGARIG